MKTKLIVAASAFSAVLAAQNGAYLEYKMSSSKGANGTVKVNYSEHGNSSEFNMVIPQMPGGGMNYKSLAPASNPGIIYVLNDKDKTYSEVNKTESNDTKTYEVKKLGEEKINGYKCVHATVSDGKETQEIWNTKDVADFAKYQEAFKNNKRLSSSKREQALKDAGCEGIPVKMISKGNEREGEMTMELVKLEKKSFSKSDFELPAGYTKSGGGPGAPGGPQVKSQQELMNMTPEERAKYVEEMKKKYGK